ncbi:MAG: DEAD/DEAH box helicase [Clostridia bacterium]|nr:DEAD/DEAH box helicase [Clostridia bacterium]
MNLEQLLEKLKNDASFMKQVTSWQEIPAREAAYAPWPEELDERIPPALAKHGVRALYTHQARAFSCAAQGKDFVVVTPTASGKTLCYNLPVLSAILKDNDARALYIFPTKALSADQVSELYELITLLGVDIKTFTYDGDTPGSARKAVREAGHVVVTNPDMLHSGILPHHTKWVKLFENLKYIVIDEIHAYRGIFGSNLSNVLRRLMRLCAFYGSRPTFILCSATIRNPKELAETLTGRDVELIDENGAPSGKRHMIFYNPPVVNSQLGIRKGVLGETRKIASMLVKSGISTIVFGRSRLQVEVLTRQLKELTEDPLGRSGTVRGYRSGYLPTERREIEQGLRSGRIRAVVSTNALELGIDIGSLEACVLCGYPGTVASTWQQSGRAGRRKGVSATFFVASSAPLDQFIVGHPNYFFNQNPESALLNPDNLYILLSHFKCSAYELPFRDGEEFGNAEGSEEMLEYLQDSGIVRHVGDTWHWANEDFPASEISLRTAMTENYVIMDITEPGHPRLVGEMDRFTVPMLLHENAIYLHEGQTYQVEKLDWDGHKAYIRKVDSDYYTDADLNVSLSLLDVDREEGSAALGEVKVTALVKVFKKMRFETNENVGYGEVMLPETDMHTTAFWMTLDEEIASGYSRDDLQGGMLGIANLMRIAAPFDLMCGPGDLQVQYQVKCPFTDKPTLILYDNCPGGIGLSDKAFRMRDMILGQCLDNVTSCGCLRGCPSCVGPEATVGPRGKRTAAEIIRRMLDGGGEKNAEP